MSPFVPYFSTRGRKIWSTISSTMGLGAGFLVMIAS